MNTDACIKLFLITHTCTVQKQPTVMRCTFLSVVFCVYSCRIFKNKYEVILYSHNLLFPFIKIRASHVSKRPLCLHRVESSPVLLCCNLFKWSTVRLPPLSRKSCDVSWLSMLSYYFLVLVSRGLEVGGVPGLCFLTRCLGAAEPLSLLPGSSWHWVFIILNEHVATVMGGKIVSCFNLCLFLMSILHTCHLFLFLRIAKHSSSSQKYSCFFGFSAWFERNKCI